MPRPYTQLQKQIMIYPDPSFQSAAKYAYTSLKYNVENYFLKPAFQAPTQ